MKRFGFNLSTVASVLVLTLAVTGCSSSSEKSVTGFELEQEIQSYSDVPDMFASEIAKALPTSNKVGSYQLHIENSVNVGYLKSDAERNIELFYSKYENKLADLQINIIIFKNPSWAKKKIETLYASEEDLNLITNDFGNGNFFTKNSCKNSNSLYGYALSMSKPLIVISAQCTSPELLNDSEQAPIQLSVITHELTHVVQDAISEDEENCFLPNWFIEGQAQAISSVISIYEGENYQKEIRADWFNWNPSGRLDDNENYVSPGSDKGDGGVYSDGSLAIEYLVARSGWKKMEKVMVLSSQLAGGKCGSLGKMSYFKGAFRIVYNQEFQDFQNEVNKYLHWSIDNS
jgi:hypothetical protein